MTPSVVEVLPGRPAPLGATVRAGGVNFSVFAKHADGMELLLFPSPDGDEPPQVVTLDPSRHRTSYYWHVEVAGIGPGQAYAWRARGPHAPERGLFYNDRKVLLDPYGLAVAGQALYDREAARGDADNLKRSRRSVVVDPEDYDWEDDVPLRRDRGRELIYEMHVRGFTAGDDESPPSLRGTYAGLAHRAAYLRRLGVTAVELMPVCEFDAQDAPAGLVNAWGYSSVSFFAPHRAYSSDPDPLGVVREFRDMVKALHRAGLKVILDVVFNHTAEAGPDGPTFCWRGLENRAYYIAGEDPSLYADFTGCGNTFNANHSIARRLIIDALRHWVRHMHVDGFRFDLASALSRGEDGRPLDQAPVLWSVGSDPVLADSTLIAEAWDAGGLYQLGSLPGDGFAQWNGAFRDDVRRFLKGEPGLVEALMARVTGSCDLLPPPDHLPFHSINYVACHDGFTLQDLVSYNRKHNEANGEQNRDGSDHNHSWNGGVEGPTDDAAILAVRRRQTRNFLTLLLLSHGTPMLLMGDECGHTRGGNNNPWCQDNALNHLPWGSGRDENLATFTQRLIAVSRALPVLQNNLWWTATGPETRGEITWHGVEPGRPDWSFSSRRIAWTLESGRGRLLLLVNAADGEARFNLPPGHPGAPWRLILDTALEPTGGLNPPGTPADPAGNSYLVADRTVAVLWSSEEKLV